jgi:hypothetical protein
MDERTLYAARDPQGVRPLVLGRLERGWVVASEQSALATVGASFIREVEPGEIEEERLWMQTIRPINAGEELLIDYCWPADAAIPCRCGALGCRGWIVDPAERHLIEERTDG